MKAVVYGGPRKIRVDQVPDAVIEKPTDVVVRLTTTNICGSDLHMYEGRTEVEEGTVLGHENLGQVIEVGSQVTQIKKGDLVCLPFNVACGYCKNCERGYTGFCLVANPGNAGAAYGYSGMGPYRGGQAELLRVPWADFNCLKLPEDGFAKQNDYVMLSDIFPTGWHAVTLSGLQPGESVVIYGCGPVGLMAAHSALIKGASAVYVVDRHPDRLRLAQKIGAIPVNDAKVDPVEHIKELTKGEGTDRGAECVGYQCHDPAGHEVPNATMNALVEIVRPTGGIGVVGVFTPEDPKSRNRLAKKGELAFDFGKFFEKGLTMGTGQTNVKRYNRHLCELIHRGRAQPSWIVSHELTLDDAPRAYAQFDKRAKGWTKVLLHPTKAR
jgi:glutathione-independent formaldehyde dehydrogenase